MASYKVEKSSVKVSWDEQPADLFKVGFGDPAQNDVIVRDAVKALDDLGELHGAMALINGPASLPAAAVLIHRLSHRYETIAVFDPKLSAYVVVIPHGNQWLLGDLIRMDNVKA